MGSSRHGSSTSRAQRPLGGHDDVVDPEVVAARAAQPDGRPGVLDRDVLRREHRDAELRHAVDDTLDAVAVEHVGVLAAAREAPSTVHPVAVVDGRDRPGRVEDAGHDHVRAGRTPRRRSRGAARRGRTRNRRRSSRSRPRTRRRGPAPRTPASRTRGRRRARRGWAASTTGSSRRRSARRAGHAAACGRPRPRRPAPRWSGASARTASRTPCAWSSARSAMVISRPPIRAAASGPRLRAGPAARRPTRRCSRRRPR